MNKSETTIPTHSKYPTIREIAENFDAVELLKELGMTDYVLDGMSISSSEDKPYIANIHKKGDITHTKRRTSSSVNVPASSAPRKRAISRWTCYRYLHRLVGLLRSGWLGMFARSILAGQIRILFSYLLPVSRGGTS